MLKIDTVITPNSIEQDSQFDDSIVVMIDVLRSSTSVCAALNYGCREIIPCDSTDKAVQIYSSLSKESRFLGGERGGMRPSGFDAGNSPLEYTVENIIGFPVGIATVSNSDFQLFPNPVNQELSISCSDKIRNVSIFNLVGQSVFSNEYNASQIKVNVAGLANGVYFIKMNGTEVRKFIKE